MQSQFLGSIPSRSSGALPGIPSYSTEIFGPDEPFLPFSHVFMVYDPVVEDPYPVPVDSIDR
jgi:hypothetical protein